MMVISLRPAWIVDFAPAGLIEDLTPYVEKDKDLQWDDVAPFFRDFNSYDGKVYSIPLDGDMHMVYYRIDSLAEAGLEPPKTWDDYLAVAKALTGKTLTGTANLIMDLVSPRPLRSNPTGGSGPLLHLTFKAREVVRDLSSTPQT